MVGRGAILAPGCRLAGLAPVSPSIISQEPRTFHFISPFYVPSFKALRLPAFHGSSLDFFYLEFIVEAIAFSLLDEAEIDSYLQPCVRHFRPASFLDGDFFPLYRVGTEFRGACSCWYQPGYKPLVRDPMSYHDGHGKDVVV